jgi:hypothetical protein
MSWLECYKNSSLPLTVAPPAGAPNFRLPLCEESLKQFSLGVCVSDILLTNGSLLFVRLQQF